MARKKTTQTKAGARKTKTNVGKGKKNGDATKRIRGTLLLKYRAVSAEWSESRYLVEQAAMRLHAEKAKPVHAPLVKLLDEYQQLLDDLKARSRELNGVQEQIAKKLGVTDLKPFFEGHSIDTVTGEVKPVEGLK